MNLEKGKKRKFFQEYGNKLTFESLEVIDHILSKIDRRVKSDSNVERERYYILNYVPTLGRNDLLQYPVTIECIDLGEKTNLPDFKINQRGKEYILEAVMATTQEYMYQSRVVFKDVKFTEHHVWIEEDKVRIKTRNATGGLTGRPIGNFVPENAFALLVKEAILKKTEKLQKYSIDNTGKELLIYYNFPLQLFLNKNDAVFCLYNVLDRDQLNKAERNFDKIHVMNDSWVIYDILNESEIQFLNI